MPWILLPNGLVIGTVDPATQWTGGISAVESAVQRVDGSVPWILLRTNCPVDRCRGSCYLMGRCIGAVDPAVQWTGGYVPWILLPNGPADRCCGSCCPMGRRIGAVDPSSQWAGG
jgi:hypothetical protein